MPYPRRTESADACAALMAMLPSQSPLELGNTPRIRTRYLQEERPSPYHAPTSASVPSSKSKSKRNSPPGKCRAARLGLNLGWGAFLKDETLRTLDGTVVRAAQIRTPVFNAGGKLFQASMMRDCWFTERDVYSSSPDPPLWLPHDPLHLSLGARRDDVKAADEMFAMFIQLDELETCMEVD